MAEELKSLLAELAHVIEKLPNTAIYILLGLGIFKLIIYLSTSGSIVYVIKLIVEKAFLAYTSEKPPKKEPIRQVRIDGKFITMDGTYQEFQDMVCYYIRKRDSKSKGEYIHLSDVQWMRAAFQEKFDKENKESGAGGD